MGKSRLRKEFERKKKRKGAYNQFGGKKDGYDIHHIIPLNDGGTNENKNLTYLKRWVHKLTHRMLRAGETDNVEFSKSPSEQQAISELGQGCLDKFKRTVNR